MQSRKALKPSLKPLSRSVSGKEPPGSPPAEQAGATASVSLNTACAKVSIPYTQQENDVALRELFWKQPARIQDCVCKLP